MPTPEPRKISVFIASPGDVAAERLVFKSTIEDLNQGFGRGADVVFVPVEWEDQLAESGRRVQDVLNQRIADCDLFVLVLHTRWGRRDDNPTYSSFTEEEYETAMTLWKNHGLPEVLVFFKNVPNAQLADPGEQLKPVLAFRKKLQDEGKVLYKSFDNEQQFGKEIEDHLCAFSRGAWKNLETSPPPVEFPSSITGPLQPPAGNTPAPAGKAASPPLTGDLSLVRDAQKDFALARAAVEAAGNSRIEDARILFAQATQSTTDLAILDAAASFYRQIGEYDNAGMMLQRQASIARDRRAAAEAYMKLLPHGILTASVQMVMDQLLPQYEPAVQEEIRSICDEVYGGDKIEKITLEMIVNAYTLEEIVQLSAFLASPVGQSSIRKQILVAQGMAQYGQQEFMRVLIERHPQLA
ncbi:MAG: DUF4062 domain-containing protein, partial [Acidobacteriaceae bacterium]